MTTAVWLRPTVGSFFSVAHFAPRESTRAAPAVDMRSIGPSEADKGMAVPTASKPTKVCARGFSYQGSCTSLPTVANAPPLLEIVTLPTVLHQ